jgi:hypothetical protein
MPVTACPLAILMQKPACSFVVGNSSKVDFQRRASHFWPYASSAITLVSRSRYRLPLGRPDQGALMVV